MCVCVCPWCWCVPSLAEVNEKHHVISETGQSVGRWHGDDEGKHVIDEGVERLLRRKQKSARISQNVPISDTIADFILHLKHSGVLTLYIKVFQGRCATDFSCWIRQKEFENRVYKTLNLLVNSHVWTDLIVDEQLWKHEEEAEGVHTWNGGEHAIKHHLSQSYDRFQRQAEQIDFSFLHLRSL